MVDRDTEFTKENIRVGDDVYIDVEYCWNVDGERVNIYLRYEDGRMETFSFWPANTLFDDSSVLDHIRMCAALDYSVRE